MECCAAVCVPCFNQAICPVSETIQAGQVFLYRPCVPEREPWRHSPGRVPPDRGRGRRLRAHARRPHRHHQLLLHETRYRRECCCMCVWLWENLFSFYSAVDGTLYIIIYLAIENHYLHLYHIQLLIIWACCLCLFNCGRNCLLEF